MPGRKSGKGKFDAGNAGRLCTSVKIILAAQIAVLVVHYIMEKQYGVNIARHLAVVPGETLRGLHLWQLLTYSFVHAGNNLQPDALKLLFSALMLWMIVHEIEAVWGAAKVVAFYCVCAAGAGLVAALFAPKTVTTGSAGAMLGVFAAYGILFGNRDVFGFIKVKYIVLLVALLTVWSMKQPDGTYNLTQLAGLVFGYAVVKAAPLKQRFDRALDRRRANNKTMEMAAMHRDVDRLLDKISREGIGSLTRREKSLLNRASKTYKVRD
jgi:membrane associated rhomboid family serine protease